ncbi:MAG: LptF/LptG family permease, partial [Leptotrichiaceae bacterium]|nr:LptF/LptG family permease [Leptotrichiaceae bacterium]
MKIIDKYIYNSLILPSIFGISIFTFILMLNVLIEAMERLFASDLPFLSVIDYFFYVVPGILVQTIPMGAFLGVMLVYGGLSETNEIIAMEGSGISLFRIIRPAFIFGLILTFIGLGLEIYVNPRALENINKQTKVLLSTRPSSLTEEKIFLTNPEKGFGFYIDKVDNKKASASQFLLLNKQGNNPYPVIFLAENARFDPGVIVLNDVKGYSFDKEGNSQVAAEYREQHVPISTFFSSGEGTHEKKRSEMNLKELREFYKNNINNPETKEVALKALIEAYQRLIG